MKFRTEVEIPISDKKIIISDAIFSIGSCFATEISTKLDNGQLQTLNNPYGTLFNPWAVNNCLKDIYNQKTYSKEDLEFYQNHYLSLHHHTSFNGDDAEKVLNKINQKISEAYNFLKRSNWVIITYGTAFVYEYLPKNILVANCHKIPQKSFKKRFLTHQELVNSIQETCDIINKICPINTQILFSLSPVRHTKDGFAENNLSKAKLLCAISDVVYASPLCSYIPIYEIMMDELRDYRFYKEDMIHPTEQAVSYIFEKFGVSYFSEETKDFISENTKILQSLQHRPSDKNSQQHLEFLKKLNDKIIQQQSKVQHKIFRSFSL